MVKDEYVDGLVAKWMKVGTPGTEDELREKATKMFEDNVKAQGQVDVYNKVQKESGTCNLGDEDCEGCGS